MEFELELEMEMEMEMLVEDEQRHHLPALLFSTHGLQSTRKPQEAMEAWPFVDHLQAADFLRDWAEEHATPPPPPDARCEDMQQHEEDVAFWERMCPDMAPGDRGFRFDGGGAAPDARFQDQQQHEEDVAFWETLCPDMAPGDGGFRLDVGGGGADEDDHLQATELLNFLRDWAEEHATPAAAGSPTVARAAPDARSSSRMCADLARGDGRFYFGGADEDESNDSTAPMEGVVLAWGGANFYTVDDVDGGDDTAAVVAPLIDLELRL